jgi:hypothetical protein
MGSTTTPSCIHPNVNHASPTANVQHVSTDCFGRAVAAATVAAAVIHSTNNSRVLSPDSDGNRATGDDGHAAATNHSNSEWATSAHTITASEFIHAFIHSFIH